MKEMHGKTSPTAASLCRSDAGTEPCSARDGEDPPPPIRSIPPSRSASREGRPRRRRDRRVLAARERAQPLRPKSGAAASASGRRPSSSASRATQVVSVAQDPARRQGRRDARSRARSLRAPVAPSRRIPLRRRADRRRRRRAYPSTAGDEGRTVRAARRPRDPAILAFCEKAANDGMSGVEPAGRAGASWPRARSRRRRSRRSCSARTTRKARSAAGELAPPDRRARRVTDRLMPKGQAPPPARELTLSSDDFLKLARLREETDPESLPGNVFAPVYTDVTDRGPRPGPDDSRAGVPGRHGRDPRREAEGLRPHLRRLPRAPRAGPERTERPS